MEARFAAALAASLSFHILVIGVWNGVGFREADRPRVMEVDVVTPPPGKKEPLRKYHRIPPRQSPPPRETYPAGRSEPSAGSKPEKPPLRPSAASMRHRRAGLEKSTGKSAESSGDRKVPAERGVSGEAALAPPAPGGAPEAEAPREEAPSALGAESGPVGGPGPGVAEAGAPQGTESGGLSDESLPGIPPGNPPPRYPPIARRRGWEGTVVIEVRVSRSGRVLTARIDRSSGYEILDEAALDAIRQWRLAPHGKPEAAFRIPVSFRLMEP